MPKFAPAREDGLKPWVVAVSSWGRTTERIEYAESARQATYQAVGRMQHTYGKARRATPDDMERLKGPTHAH